MNANGFLRLVAGRT